MRAPDALPVIARRARRARRAALYVVVQQYRYDYVADLDWPGRFTSINNLAWLAVVLLLADVVVERVRGAAGLHRDRHR